MKLIKNCLFYLFLVLAVLSTVISIGVSGSEGKDESFVFFVLSLVALWTTTAALWTIVIVGFKNQLIEYLAKKRDYEDDFEYTEVDEYTEVRQKLRPTYGQEFAYCYSIAEEYETERKVDRILEELKNRKISAVA